MSEIYHSIINISITKGKITKEKTTQKEKNDNPDEQGVAG